MAVIKLSEFSRLTDFKALERGKKIGQWDNLVSQSPFYTTLVSQVAIVIKTNVFMIRYLWEECPHLEFSSTLNVLISLVIRKSVLTC